MPHDDSRYPLCGVGSRSRPLSVISAGPTRGTAQEEERSARVGIRISRLTPVYPLFGFGFWLAKPKIISAAQKILRNRLPADDSWTSERWFRSSGCVNFTDRTGRQKPANWASVAQAGL